MCVSTRLLLPISWCSVPRRWGQNFLDETIGRDLGEPNIAGLDSPESESLFLPGIGFELDYVFIGNLLEDYLRFDFHKTVIEPCRHPGHKPRHSGPGKSGPGL